MKYTDTIIKSVKEYLDWLDDATISTVISDTGNEIDFENPILYFRGQTSIKELNPGIFREPFSPGMIEHKILHKASLHLWKELSTYTLYLEKLVFLQHYGMPTRLLDVTFNPLIALYFACSKQNGSDGVVYCGFQENEEHEYISELTSEYLFKQSFDYFEKEMKTFIDVREESLFKFSQPIFITPPINNPRIENQNGSFIMAPLIKIGKENIYLNTDSLDDCGLFSEKRALIPDSCKQNIIRNLHKFGFNKGNIYQGVGEKIETLVQEKKWEIEYYKISTEGF